MAHTPWCRLFSIREPALYFSSTIYSLRQPMGPKLYVLIFLMLGMLTEPALGRICQSWGKARIIGSLDAQKLPEASGLVASRRYSDRLYHVNDSGNSPMLYVTDLEGHHLQGIRIQGIPLHSADFEDIGVGPFPTFDSCIFIGNIGKHRTITRKAERDVMEVLVIPELSQFPPSLVPAYRLKFRLSTGAHDAEGLAIHPNGDLFVMTKETHQSPWRKRHTKLFKLERQAWETQPHRIHKLTRIGQLDMPRISKVFSTFLGYMVTGFDIAPDGTSFLILTYEDAYEFNVDLKQSTLPLSRDLTEGSDYTVISLKVLPQQEGITYLPGTNSFLYNTEIGFRLLNVIRGHAFNTDHRLPLVRIDCEH